MKTIREVAVIIFIAVVIAFLINWKFHPTPLPWIHEDRQVESASNALLDSMMNAGTTSAQLQAATPSQTTMPAATTVQSATAPQKSIDSAAGKKSGTEAKQPASTKAPVDPAAKEVSESHASTVKTNSPEPAQSASIKLPIAVNYDQIVKLLANPSNVAFLDARKKEEHDKGCIQGSMNIDILQFNENPQYRDQCMRTLYSIPKDRVIVSYCGGGNCELSHELCDVLIPMGFKRVLIYLGGWTEFSEKQGIKK